MPRKFHRTADEAEQEAVRLARAHPGKKFIVLHAYRKYVVPE